MIHELNVFSPKSYVVAEDWNNNFSALNTSNTKCANAIDDAEGAIAFPDGDLSGVFSSVNGQPNSYSVAGGSVVIQPECEYYKTLSDSQDLSISVPTGFNGEAQIILKTQNARSLKPFNFLYSGEVIYVNDSAHWKDAGIMFLFLYESNSKLFVKLAKGA